MSQTPDSAVDRSPGRDVAVPYPHLERWGRAAAVLIALLAPLMLFVYDYLRADLYTLDFVRIELPVSDTEIFLNHLRLTAVSLTAVLLCAAGLVLWLVWQYRAHANLAALGVPGLRFTPATAVTSWLLPVANLALPLLATRELWRASDPHSQGSEWRRRWTNPLIWLWWAGLLAAVVFLVKGVWIGLGAPGSDDLIARDRTLQLAAVITMPTAIIPAILIAWIDRRLVLLADRIRFPDWHGWSRP